MQKIIKQILKIAVLVAVFMPFYGVNAASPVCTLTANNSNEVVRNLPTNVLVSNLNMPGFGNSSNLTGITVPAGKYTITAQTFDAHSEHGGLGQTREQVYFNFFNSNGSLILKTGNTTDIAENSDYQTTGLGTVTVGSDIRRIEIVHAAKGASTKYESVAPVCLKFSKIEDPVVPPPVTPDAPTAVCTVNDSSVRTGDTVLYSVNASGGKSPYAYGWYGTVSGVGQQISKTFNSTGSYTAYVTVLDSNSKFISVNCPTVVVNNNNDNNDNEDLEVECKVSDSSIEEGDRITIKVEIDGGEGPYDIDWSGDTDEVDDFDDDARTQRVEFEDSGTYKFRVTVEDNNGDEDSDTCTVRVSDDRNRTASTVTNTTDGELASLSSVYLNQVPYTGPEDTAKLIGFISLIVLWSAVIAYYALRNKNKGYISARIKAFKQANLANKI